MINYLTFDGKNLRDFGVYVNGTYTYSSPERSIERIVVPGRSGTLTIDNQRFENIEISYASFIVRDFANNIEGLRNYLSTSAGYRRLEETYHPDEYRMARFVSGLQVEATPLLREGNFTMVFDCKPQRYLKSGEQYINFNSAGTLYNPTIQIAKPLIRVWGNGTVGVGDATLTITGTGAEGYTDIDCESMDAYCGATNRNNGVSGTFPVLNPGANGIALGGSVGLVQITPRWWIL